MLLFSVALFLAMVAACLLAGVSVAWGLLGGLAVFWGLGLYRGFTWRQLWDMAWKKAKQSLIVVRIILLIGIITGTWRVSGTIAACILQGVSLIRPSLFLVMAFLLCALLSYALGTSYGVSSTMGVILMALARSGGVSPTITAGVVLSGVYFGDRCSPASSAASLVAAVTETDLYRNVRQMLRTGLLPTLLTLLAYVPLSLANPLSAVDPGVLSALQTGFSRAWPVFLPAAAIFLLPLLKAPIRMALWASILLSGVLALLLQGVFPVELLRAAVFGYHPADAALEGVLGGGGILSMSASYATVLLAGAISGVLEGTGSLSALDDAAGRLAGRIGRFPAMIVVSFLSAAVLCNQAVTSMMCAQVLGGSYENREELAMDIENSGILIAGLIPWSIACSIPLAMLGADAGALPYALLLWLIPLCYLPTKRRFYPEDIRKNT